LNQVLLKAKERNEVAWKTWLLRGINNAFSSPAFAATMVILWLFMGNQP